MLYSSLYPLSIQARCSGHSRQLSEMSGMGCRLVLSVVHRVQDDVVALLEPLNERDVAPW